MLTTVFRTFILYIYIILIYRIMGKKEISELGVGDLIVSILMAELAALSIEGDTSLLISIFPITLLGVMEMVLSYISMKSDKLRRLIDGKPSVIVKNGKIKFSVMSKLRYSLDDLLTQLRVNGVKNISDVSYAILETNGELSVFKDNVYPIPLILDTKIQYETLKEIGKDEEWLNKLLIKHKLDINNVFYAFYTKHKTYFIKKDELI